MLLSSILEKKNEREARGAFKPTRKRVFIGSYARKTACQRERPGMD